MTNLQPQLQRHRTVMIMGDQQQLQQLVMYQHKHQQKGRHMLSLHPLWFLLAPLLLPLFLSFCGFEIQDIVGFYHLVFIV
jgi:hypothetical protein